jgi:hypothetical protein
MHRANQGSGIAILSTTTSNRCSHCNYPRDGGLFATNDLLVVESRSKWHYNQQQDRQSELHTPYSRSIYCHMLVASVACLGPKSRGAWSRLVRNCYLAFSLRLLQHGSPSHSLDLSPEYDIIAGLMSGVNIRIAQQSDLCCT